MIYAYISEKNEKIVKIEEVRTIMLNLKISNFKKNLEKIKNILIKIENSKQIKPICELISNLYSNSQSRLCSI